MVRWESRRKRKAMNSKMPLRVRKGGMTLRGRREKEEGCKRGGKGEIRGWGAERATLSVVSSFWRLWRVQLTEEERRKKKNGEKSAPNSGVPGSIQPMPVHVISDGEIDSNLTDALTCRWANDDCSWRSLRHGSQGRIPGIVANRRRLAIQPADLRVAQLHLTACATQYHHSSFLGRD